MIGLSVAVALAVDVRVEPALIELQLGSGRRVAVEVHNRGEDTVTFDVTRAPWAGRRCAPDAIDLSVGTHVVPRGERQSVEVRAGGPVADRGCVEALALDTGGVRVLVPILAATGRGATLTIEDVAVVGPTRPAGPGRGAGSRGGGRLVGRAHGDQPGASPLDGGDRLRTKGARHLESCSVGVLHGHVPVGTRGHLEHQVQGIGEDFAAAPGLGQLQEAKVQVPLHASAIREASLGLG